MACVHQGRPWSFKGWEIELHKKSLELKMDLRNPRSQDVSAQARSGGQTALSATPVSTIYALLVGNKRGSTHWTNRLNVKPPGLKMAPTLRWWECENVSVLKHWWPSLTIDQGPMTISWCAFKQVVIYSLWIIITHFHGVFFLLI